MKVSHSARIAFASMTPDDRFDVVVVGGGAAGLYSALTAADAGSRVAMVSRKPLSESSSFWAQGGLAAAIGPDDSPEQHVEDTRRRRARSLQAVRRGAARARGARASSGSSSAAASTSTCTPTRALSLALEGGHSRRRIVHAGRRGDRPPDHRAARRAGGARRADRGDREDLGGRPLGRRRALLRRAHGPRTDPRQGDDLRHRAARPPSGRGPPTRGARSARGP